MKDGPSPSLRIVVLGAAALVGLVALGLHIKKRRNAKKLPQVVGKVVGRVRSIHVYPVKSCGGHALTSHEVEPRGFKFDRLWMVVDANGRFQTQRQLPPMALIRPTLPKSTTEPLVLEAPGMPALSVPPLKGKVVGSSVWGTAVEGWDQGDQAAQWLSMLLKKEGLRLLRFVDGYKRPVDPEFAGKNQYTSFADDFPFLLISQASLDALNTRLAEPVPMNRFRPNIVVEGVEAFAEDSWSEIRIGDMEMRVVKPCARCKVPNTNQESGEVGEEPGNTLRAFRKGSQLSLREKWKDDIFFGQNLIHGGARGSIRVGDPVVVYTDATD